VKRIGLGGRLSKESPAGYDPAHEPGRPRPPSANQQSADSSAAAPRDVEVAGAKRRGG
jgi:hypothetical protein